MPAMADITRSIRIAELDPCNPTLCALGRAPHAHCPCGLAMPAGAALCDQCRAEGFQPKPLTLADYDVEWDRVQYPSRRHILPTDIPRAASDARGPARRAVARDPAASGELHSRHRDMVHRVLNRLLSDFPSDVDDVASQVFLAAFEQMPMYEDRGRPFAAWLRSIL